MSSCIIPSLISGPETYLSFTLNLGNKIIYYQLFGDTHGSFLEACNNCGNDDKCMDVVEYVKMFMQCSKAPTHLFIEEFKSGLSSAHQVDDFLSKMDYTFITQMVYDKKKSYVHKFDQRNNGVIDYIMEETFPEAFALDTAQQTWFDLTQNILYCHFEHGDYRDNVRKKFPNLTTAMEKANPYWYKGAASLDKSHRCISKVHKQLSALSEQLQRQIRVNMHRVLQAVRNAGYCFWDGGVEDLLCLGIISGEYASSTWSMYVVITSIVMEIYGLLRSLRDFDIDKGTSTKNVIYYAGSQHIWHLYGIFQILFPDQIQEIQNHSRTSMRCIQVNKPTKTERSKRRSSESTNSVVKKRKFTSAVNQ